MEDDLCAFKSSTFYTTVYKIPFSGILVAVFHLQIMPTSLNCLLAWKHLSVMTSFFYPSMAYGEGDELSVHSTEENNCN